MGGGRGIYIRDGAKGESGKCLNFLSVGGGGMDIWPLAWVKIDGVGLDYGLHADC